jgi:hypothetical protein
MNRKNLSRAILSWAILIRTILSRSILSRAIFIIALSGSVTSDGIAQAVEDVAYQGPLFLVGNPSVSANTRLTPTGTPTRTLAGTLSLTFTETFTKTLTSTATETITLATLSETSLSKTISSNTSPSDTSRSSQPRRLPTSPESKYRSTIEGVRVLTTDSLLRWQQWADAGEWLAHQPEFRVYRLGGFGRTAAVMNVGWALNRSLVRWNGVPLNDALSGQFSTADWPWEHVAALHYAGAQEAFTLLPRTFRVVRPYTWIQYEQSRDAYRVLDGTLALPISQTTQLHLSYQGQKDRGAYPRSGMEGLRSLGHVEQVLGNQSTIKAFWMYRGAELEESLGYELDALGGDAASRFHFDRYQATALASGTSSHRQHLVTGLRWQPRGQGDQEGVLVYRKLNRDRWYADQGVRSKELVYGTEVSYRWEFSRLGWLRPVFQAERMGVEAWSPRLQYAPLAWKAALHAGIHPHPWLRTSGYTQWGRRHQQAWLHTGAGLALGPETLQLHLEAMHQQTPELIFRGGTSPGYRDLQDITVARHNRGEVALSARLLDADLRAGYRRSLEDGLALARSTVVPEISYYNDLESNQYFVQFDLDRNHYEVSGGYHVTQWTMGKKAGLDAGQLNPQDPGEASSLSDRDRSLRLAAYYKSAVIGRAAFLKVGASYRKILEAYPSPLWIPQHQIWLRTLEGPQVPAHDLLDLELAARVRSIILTARVENALDGWLQNGYFETLPYPMPSRRFRVGLKVVFRD